MLDTILERPAIDDAQMRRNAFNFGVPAAFRLMSVKRLDTRPIILDDPRLFRLDGDYRDMLDTDDLDRAQEAGRISPRELSALHFMLDPRHDIGHVAATLDHTGARLPFVYYVLTRADISRFARGQ